MASTPTARRPKNAKRRVEAAGRRANEGELEEVGPGYVKIVEVDEGKSVDVYLGGYVE